MKIESSVINLTSQHLKTEKYEKNENLTFWTDNQPQDVLDLSAQGKRKLFLSSIEMHQVSKEEDTEIEISDEDKLKIHLIESFVKTLTGKEIKINIPKLKIKNQECNNQEIQVKQGQKESRLGWGLSYDYVQTRQEKESMSFSADGIIKTQDGREINISLQLNMTREFMERNEIHIRAGDAKKIDPLVINFNGNLPELTDTKFSFDLDADGESEQISFLRENSGFLSLDLNSDGIINNGTELFGPQSGDGFKELSAYDEDNNGWIDENDAIYSKLRIWTKDSQGNDYLLALGEVGVGAIYLGSVSTLFEMNDSENNLLGEIQKTGLFLREDGSAGTIQHIDLAV